MICYKYMRVMLEWYLAEMRMLGPVRVWVYLDIRHTPNIAFNLKIVEIQAITMGTLKPKPGMWEVSR